MSPVKAIPVTYRSIKFRSRLEADWAATLDSINIEWVYEPEGFELSDGAYYSPDFWLPNCNTWLEVKGSHNLGIEKAEQFAADMWGTFNVALGLEPHPANYFHGRFPTPQIVGLRGIGLRSSVQIIHCYSCKRWGIRFCAGWPAPCAYCDATSDLYDCHQPPKHWEGVDICAGYLLPFVRLPRPAGKK